MTWLMQTGKRHSKSVIVLQNNYYSREEIKIFLQNTYNEKENPQKVHEYRRIDGSIVSGQNNFYDRGTVKICKGDCIAHMMPVAPFNSDNEKRT